MSYMCKRMRFRNAIEVYEYHTAKYGAPGQERQEKKKATPEQMAKRNRYNRERLARWKIRNNFDVDDYFTRLSYEKDKRPESMEEAKEDWKAFLQILRREYKKRGAELKWMRNIEVGTRGAWHIHIIVNRIPDTDVILVKASETKEDSIEPGTETITISNAPLPNGRVKAQTTVDTDDTVYSGWYKTVYYPETITEATQAVNVDKKAAGE